MLNQNTVELIPQTAFAPMLDELLFDKIAQDLVEQGFSINPNALPANLAFALAEHAQSMSATKFSEAGIGRQQDHIHNRFVRSDKIAWITGESVSGQQWLDWTEQLRLAINRKLFLGLNYFESHFAHYRPGDFYKRHMDAFKGQRNRILTLVTYLNSNWAHQDGGELVLYRDQHDLEGTQVTPSMGTLVVFLSEEFPHEVLPAARDRLSIAGWFRQAEFTL